MDFRAGSLAVMSLAPVRPSVMTRIDYFFTCISPFAYLGHEAFLEVAQRHGAQIRPRPIGLFDVWKESGALPVPQRPKMRQDYRLIELQRWREARGVPLNLKPAHFPTDPGLADRTVIAVAHRGGDALALAGRLMHACWAGDENIAEESVVSRHLSDLVDDPSSVLQEANGEEITGLYARNTEDGKAAGIIGSPAYVLNGEPFWGQDRIELLDAALRSNRAPFRPAA